MSAWLRLLASIGASALIVAALMASVWVLVPWVQTIAAGAPVSLAALVRAWRRGLRIHEIVTAYLVSAKAGVEASFEQYADLLALGGQPIRVATMLAAMRYADFPHEPARVFDLERRGMLAEYFKAWQRAAAGRQPPPPLP